MSKALNIIGWLAIVWVIQHGIYRIATHRGYSTAELPAIQLWDGILALAIGIGLLVIILQLKRMRK